MARWVSVGFIHGVMNTDNMTISGETIDYGPCAFLEAYDPAAVFSSIDTQGRYAYGNQPRIARWNLARLAETLVPLLHADADTAIALATEVIDEFPARFNAHWLRLMRRKLGIGAEEGAGASPQTVAADAADTDPNAAPDRALIDDFLSLLQAQKVDFTLAFRRLADAAAGDDTPLLRLFADDAPTTEWLDRWRAHLAPRAATRAARAADMCRTNPVYIPRNHLVESALSAATERDDLAPFERLLSVLAHPFDERIEDAEYAEPAPPTFTACYRTFCGT